METGNCQPTCECRWKGPHSDWTSGHKLSYSHLQVVQWFAYEEQHHDVRYEESSTSIPEGCVREPPNIAQPNRHGNTWHEELKSIGPLLSFWIGAFILYSIPDTILISGHNAHEDVIKWNFWIIYLFHVRFEVFTVVTMKNAIFLDATPCGSRKNGRFERVWCLHHQGDKNRWTPKSRFSQEPHGVTSQKTALFIYFITDIPKFIVLKNHTLQEIFEYLLLVQHSVYCVSFGCVVPLVSSECWGAVVRSSTW
jgi:hypothetical protein